MHPVAFLGGVTTGAAGLLAAALWDKRRAEANFPKELEFALSLDEDQLRTLLNRSYFKAQELYAKANQLSMKGGLLMDAPLELPDDSLWQRIRNGIADSGYRYLRGWYERSAENMKKETQTLFSRYRNVFIAANEKLVKEGREPVDLSSVKFSRREPSRDNSLPNEDWSLQFSERVEKITDFLEAATSAANNLIGALEGKTS